MFPENLGSHGGRRGDLGWEQGLQGGKPDEEHPQAKPGSSGAPGMIWGAPAWTETLGKHFSNGNAE